MERTLPFSPRLESRSSLGLVTTFNFVEVKIDAVKNHLKASLLVDLAPIACTPLVLLPGFLHALKSGREMDATSSMSPVPQGFLARWAFVWKQRHQVTSRPCGVSFSLGLPVFQVGAWPQCVGRCCFRNQTR